MAQSTYRIGLITTLDTNIGDDFIRAGICRVLRGAAKGRSIEFVPVNKHVPHTAYRRGHPIHTAALAQYLPRGKRMATTLLHSFFATSYFSKFDHCNAIVQCGAPVLWPECHRCEWAVLWHRLVKYLSARIPILNLAAGSCYPWNRQPVKVEDRSDADFLRAIHGYCHLTTARDSLSQLLWRDLDCDTPRIPCSALLASGEQKIETGNDGYVLINYMPGGGHFSFGQDIDSGTWRQTVKTVIQRLRARHKVAFLCHNENEMREATLLEPDLPRFEPRCPKEYFEVAAGAKAGIFNRMHASVGLAGMGIPSVAIGTDTRLLMVKEIGLPLNYVGDTTAELLEHQVETLLADREQERERLLHLRKQTYNQYLERVAPILDQSPTTSRPESLADPSESLDPHRA